MPQCLISASISTHFPRAYIKSCNQSGTPYLAVFPRLSAGDKRRDSRVLVAGRRQRRSCYCDGVLIEGNDGWRGRRGRCDSLCTPASPSHLGRGKCSRWPLILHATEAKERFVQIMKMDHAPLPSHQTDLSLIYSLSDFNDY